MVLCTAGASFTYHTKRSKLCQLRFQNKVPASWQSLSEEMALKVLGYLPFEEAIRLESVSPQFRQLLRYELWSINKKPTALHLRFLCSNDGQTVTVW